MWRSHLEKLPANRGLKFFIELDAKAATFSDVLHGWQSDQTFRAMFNSLLAECPFSAIRWETPCVTKDSLSQPFEFVVLDSPYLARPPEPTVFAEYFQQSPEEDILVFPNLGGDAMMVVPRQKTSVSAYGHLAAFVREAPEAQWQKLWQTVATAMLKRVSAKPVWLSTAGGGVSWLHVRLDDWPKYYGYGPYRLAGSSSS